MSVPVRQGTVLRIAAKASAGNDNVTIGYRGTPAGAFAQVSGFDFRTHS